MSIVDPNAANASEFPEYLDIIPAEEDPESEELIVGQRFTSKDECVNAIKRYSLKVSIKYKVADFKLMIYVGYEVEPHRFKQRWVDLKVYMYATFYRLATLIPKMGLKQVNQMNAGFVHVEHVWKGNETVGCRLDILPRSYRVDILNRQYDSGKFQTLHYPCAHVIAA
ncbi:hypothetical protein GOBAR_DD15287 [Gossypium barbadense]|nr:hypothetical protein GOBAR_DD15287 [Gossypium barbadense]